MGLKRKTADLKKRMREAIRGVDLRLSKSKKPLAKKLPGSVFFQYLMPNHSTNMIYL